MSAVWPWVLGLWLSAGDPGVARDAVLSCGPDERNREVCLTSCGSADECRFAEGICRSCAGSGSSALEQFFRGVADPSEPARAWRLSWESLPEPAGLLKLLRSGSWIAIDARSPWNYVTPWNELSLKRGFAELCGEPEDGEAWVLFELDRKGKPLRPAFVICPSRQREGSWLRASRTALNASIIPKP